MYVIPAYYIIGSGSKVLTCPGLMVPNMDTCRGLRMMEMCTAKDQSEDKAAPVKKDPWELLFSSGYYDTTRKPPGIGQGTDKKPLTKFFRNVMQSASGSTDDCAEAGRVSKPRCKWLIRYFCQCPSTLQVCRECLCLIRL